MGTVVMIYWPELLPYLSLFAGERKEKSYPR